jgi:DNA segregation ATPase FtsK/SpoIIIE, S-DNA-T family
VTDLHDRDEPGGELIRFPGPRARAEDVGSLELAETGGHQPPAVRQPHQADTPPGTELVPAEKVYDAELVDEDTAPRPAPTGVARVVRPVVVVVHQVRQHEPTVRASKAATRHLVYVVTGGGVLLKRLWEAKTNSLPERQKRAAEAAGDQERLRYWQEQGEQARERRHKRRMDLVMLPWRMAIAVSITIPVVAVLLLLIGVAVAINQDDLSLVVEPLVGTVEAVGWLSGAVIWMAGVLAFLAPALVIGVLWWVGRRAEAAPAWLRAPGNAGDTDMLGAVPDENSIVQALVHCEIPAFKKALKEGWKLHFLMPPMIDGKGWRTQIALPPASPVEEFVRRKEKLAHNLRRYPIEVWPTEPQAAVLDLWVAKPGALSGPVEPWPLLKNLDTAKADYFKGVPVGVTIKGDVIVGRLFEANYVAGGMMGSGKSTLVITTLLGAMLDPLVDIDVVVMADNADYDPMKPRLNRLVTGAGEDTVAQCMAMLHELFEDCSVRGQALREHDERAVTRELAEEDPRLRPRIMVIDECQNLFIGEHGKDAIEITVKVMSTARKYGVTLMFLTPEPSKDACPRKLISIASNKACYAIGDHQGNDAVLGSGSYKSGISAVGLTPKTDEGPGDVGTCMQRGFTAKPGLMRGFYVTQSDAHRVTQRALMLRTTQRKHLTEAPAPEKRDLLVDVGAVLGVGPGADEGAEPAAEPIPAADIPALIAARFPGQVLYRQMTGKQIRGLLLREYDVRVPSTGNRWPVSAKLIADGLELRRGLGDAAND